MSLEKAAYMRPPATGNANALVMSTTASAAIAHACVDSEEWVTFTCDVAFNILFGISTVADPGTVYPFPAGTYSFSPRRGTETHFKVRATAAGAGMWWLSS